MQDQQKNALQTVIKIANWAVNDKIDTDIAVRQVIREVHGSVHAFKLLNEWTEKTN